jgi:hypothetical protein
MTRCTECKGNGLMAGEARKRTPRKAACIDCLGTGEQMTDEEWAERHAAILDRKFIPAVQS